MMIADIRRTCAQCTPDASYPYPHCMAQRPVLSHFQTIPSHLAVVNASLIIQRIVDITQIRPDINQNKTKTTN